MLHGRLHSEQFSLSLVCFFLDEKNSDEKACVLVFIIETPKTANESEKESLLPRTPRESSYA
jgi:hypothetical protein